MQETTSDSKQLLEEMGAMTLREMRKLAVSVEANPYLTIRDFANKYSTWTESSIRWLIYTNTGNFNEIVVRRVGKSKKAKILISVKHFWEWIEQQNQNKKQNA